MLELEDGLKARMRFTVTAEVTTFTPCEGSGECEPDITSEPAALIFRTIDVDYDVDALGSAQKVMMENKAEQLFPALHTSPAFWITSSSRYVPPPGVIRAPKNS